MIEPIHIISSNINAIGYEMGKLFIRFNSGITYRYEDVPHNIFDSLQKVESAGKFFHRFIRDKFRCNPLSPEDNVWG